MVSLTATSALFNMIPQLFNCWVLTIVPIVAGLILGSLILNAVRLFFIVVGATAGGVIGWYAYTSLSLSIYASDGESDWLYYVCLVIPAIAGGCSGAEQSQQDQRTAEAKSAQNWHHGACNRGVLGDESTIPASGARERAFRMVARITRRPTL